MRNLASCLILMFALVSECYAQRVDDEKFRIQFRDTVASASKEYDETLEKSKRLASRYGMKACQFGELKDYRCAWSAYVAPYPLTLPHKVPAGWGGVPLFSWVPVGQTRGGLETVAEWKRIAAAGTLFDCTGPICNTIIHSLTRTNDGDIWAWCQIPKIEEIIGVPEKCVPLVITGRNQTWVKALSGYLDETAGARSPIFKIVIVRPPTPSMDSVLTSSQRALTAPPLKLRTEFFLQSSLEGMADIRFSEVLKHGWEQVSIRIDAEVENLPTPTVSLYISIHLLVNDHNTDRPQDWHQPTKQQTETYWQTLRLNIKPELKSLCENADWKDDKTLLCR